MSIYAFYTLPFANAIVGLSKYDILFELLKKEIQENSILICVLY